MADFYIHIYSIYEIYSLYFVKTNLTGYHLGRDVQKLSVGSLLIHEYEFELARNLTM